MIQLIIDTLITDRSQADVDYLRMLFALGWDAMSETQRQQYTDGYNDPAAIRGGYNGTDLNRVEGAAQEIEAYLAALPGVLAAYLESIGVAPDTVFDVPYQPFSLVTRTNWDRNETPNAADLARYLGNVVTLLSKIPANANSPESMERLDWQGANDIERALLAEWKAANDFEADTKDRARKTAAAFRHCGTFYSGMEGLRI